MFANVDLEVSSRRDLSSLVEALAPKAFLLHERRERGVHVVAFELSELRYRTPDACIARFATLLERLTAQRRKLWDGATQRRFDIGIHAPAEWPAYAGTVTPKTLRRAAELGAAIAVTVYPSEPRPEAPQPTRPARATQLPQAARPTRRR